MPTLMRGVSTENESTQSIWENIELFRVRGNGIDDEKDQSLQISNYPETGTDLNGLNGLGSIGRVIPQKK